MKYFILIILNIFITFGLIYYFVGSKNIIIKEGQNIQKNINIQNGQIILENKSSLSGNINLEEGNVLIKPFSLLTGNLNIKYGNIEIQNDTKIKGNIYIKNGNIRIKRNTIINGNINIEKGGLKLEENVKVIGNIKLSIGELKKHSTSKIIGLIPDIYITYDRPASLVYFDILPEKHKKSLGYVFLTKKDNTLIRSENIKKAKQYFDGIYYYEDKKLKSIDLNDENKVKPFFDNAKKFFTILPERKLGPYSVGAATKNFSYKKGYADIYVPSTYSENTFVHEMGHVVDFKYNYIDYHNPIFPYISKKIAVNDYAATHPGEDFAESYRYYILYRKYFINHLIKEEPKRQQKYDFLKKYVFDNKEYLN